VICVPSIGDVRAECRAALMVNLKQPGRFGPQVITLLSAGRGAHAA